MRISKQGIDRPWKDYPVGTRAHAVNGGHWMKIESGRWRWCTGSTFETPGGDTCSITLPEDTGVTNENF